MKIIKHKTVNDAIEQMKMVGLALKAITITTDEAIENMNKLAYELRKTKKLVKVE